MEKYSLTQPLTIGALREVLKYRSREAMGKNWRLVFADQVLPLDHLIVDAKDALTFVRAISIPQRGRPGDITGAAQLFLKTLDGSEFIDLPEVEKNQATKTRKVKVEPEKIAQSIEVVDSIVPQTFWDLISSKLRASTEKIIEKIFNLSGLEVAYFTTIGIADYGLVYLLKEMGLAAAVVYTLISLHALSMAQDRKSQNTATKGIFAVWILEILAFVVHLSLFHKRLWQTINDLPFRVEDVTTESRPFYIAAVLAFLFSAAGIYAVSIMYSLLREKIEAEQFETTHGIKY